MFARVATFDDVDVSRADEVTAEMRKVALPLVQDLSGWSGQLTLIDQKARRVLGITFFQTREDIEAAEPVFEEMPQRLPTEIRDMIAGHRRSVAVYDVQVAEGIRLGEHTAVAH